ncbi:unknown [Lactococcus phage P335]|nr:unknown [Lactococcus phage P335]
MDEDGCIGGCLIPIILIMFIIWFGRYALHWW